MPPMLGLALSKDEPAEGLYITAPGNGQARASKLMRFPGLESHDIFQV